MPKMKPASSTARKNGTVLAACTCVHKFQDKEYNGRRLHNLCAGGVKRRCTVCGKETVI